MYYNQVLGLDAYLVTIALAIALIFDAISDPLVGIWSDRILSLIHISEPTRPY